MTAPATELSVLQHRLTPERMTPYLAAADGDSAAAVDLYVWNANLSGYLNVTLGHVEILLRNAIHEHLTAWSLQRFDQPRWYLDPGRLLHTRARQDIQTARQRATRQRRVETAGRVVAELGLGFWRYLVANHYDGTLWREALYRAFPGQPYRRIVYDATEVLHLCRNRLAHREPIFNRPVEDIHFTALALADWICPVSRAWIERHCLTLPTLVQRPFPPFRPEPGSWQAWERDWTFDAGEPPR